MASDNASTEARFAEECAEGKWALFHQMETGQNRKKQGRGEAGPGGPEIDR